MTKTELFLEYLTTEGYRPSLDEDQDITFKHERINYILFPNEKDDTFFRLMIPFFWELETPEETERATKVMMKLNADYKAAKFYVMQNDVCVAAEAFYAKPEDVKPLLGRYIDLLASAMREFRQLMRDEPAPSTPMAQA
jgi:hypothetical protein